MTASLLTAAAAAVRLVFASRPTPPPPAAPVITAYGLAVVVQADPARYVRLS